MGTYYSLGIIKNFVAKSNEVISDLDWTHHLNQRIDLSLFDLDISSHGMHIEGTLKEGIFEKNINDFYDKLEQITHRGDIKDYLEESGVEIDDYYDDYTSFFLKPNTYGEISVDITFATLFTEGKVLVEEFDMEPMLMNWLFRHADFGNCLSGCVISSITG